MSYGQVALNVVHGGFRMMTDFVAPVSSAFVLLELARRGYCVAIYGSARHEIKPTSNNSLTNSMLTVMFPFRESYCSNRWLVKASIATCAFGIIGSTVLRKAIGDVPPMCNRVLSVLGPVRISDKPWAVLRWFSH
jgi:hypothetical protein